jgi:hypothetical protein
MVELRRASQYPEARSDSGVERRHNGLAHLFSQGCSLNDLWTL